MIANPFLEQSGKRMRWMKMRTGRKRRRMIASRKWGLCKELKLLLLLLQSLLLLSLLLPSLLLRH